MRARFSRRVCFVAVPLLAGCGGVARLQALRLKGHSTVPGADGQTFAAAVDVRIQLPDKYLRIETGPFGRRLTGYAVATPLALLEDSSRKVISEPTDAATVEAAREELARFMLGAAEAMTMTIVERKSSGGYKLPSHIVTTAGARVVDDMSFDEIAVNPKFRATEFAK